MTPPASACPPLLTPTCALGCPQGAGSAPLFTLAAHNKATCALSFCPAVPGLMATASTDKKVGRLRVCTCRTPSFTGFLPVSTPEPQPADLGALAPPVHSLVLSCRRIMPFTVSLCRQLMQAAWRRGAAQQANTT